MAADDQQTDDGLAEREVREDGVGWWASGQSADEQLMSEQQKKWMDGWMMVMIGLEADAIIRIGDRWRVICLFGIMLFDQSVVP